MIRFSLDGVKHEFDEKVLGNLEAMELQKFSGLTVQEFYKGLQVNEAKSLTAVVWLTHCREDHPLAYSDVVFNVLEFLETLEDDEETDDEADPSQPAEISDES